MIIAIIQRQMLIAHSTDDALLIAHSTDDALHTVTASLRCA